MFYLVYVIDSRWRGVPPDGGPLVHAVQRFSSVKTSPGHAHQSREPIRDMHQLLPHPCRVAQRAATDEAHSVHTSWLGRGVTVGVVKGK